MFSGYLVVRDHCPHCGEALHHQRADDAPPWITIMVVGHLVIPAMAVAAVHSTWPDAFHMVLWPALVVALSLTVLPLAKGAVVGLQWALRMHGFGGPPDDDLPSADDPRGL